MEPFDIIPVTIILRHHSYLRGSPVGFVMEWYIVVVIIYEE